MPFDAQTLKQPWVRYSLMGVAGIGVIWIVMRNMGGSQSVIMASGGSDPALAQLQAQQNQLAAASATSASNNQFQLALDAQKSAEQLEYAKLSALTSTAQQVNQISGTLNLAHSQATAAVDTAAMQTAGQIQLAGIQSQNIQQQYAAQTTLGLAQTNAITNISQINATAQAKMAETLAHTQEAISQTASNVAITQANNAKDVQIAQTNNAAKTAQNASNNTSNDSMFSDIAGLAMAFL